MAVYYHDDPIEETPAPRRKVPGILASILILLAGGLFLNTTLAGNISINSGAAVEFGQSVVVSAACAGYFVFLFNSARSAIAKCCDSHMYVRPIRAF